MTHGIFTPLFVGTLGETPDPFLANVVLSLHMEDTGDGFTLKDNSPKNIQFTRYFDAHITAQNKKFGKTSAYFKGMGDMYRASAAIQMESAQDRTVEFWFFDSGTVNTGYLLSFNNATRAFFARINKATATLEFWKPTNVSTAMFASIAAPAVGMWHHISMNCKNQVWSAYLNGVLLSSTSTTNVLIPAPIQINIGSSSAAINNDSANRWTGYIDEVRAWLGVSIRDGVNNFSPPTKPWADK